MQNFVTEHTKKLGVPHGMGVESPPPRKKSLFLFPVGGEKSSSLTSSACCLSDKKSHTKSQHSGNHPSVMSQGASDCSLASFVKVNSR